MPVTNSIFGCCDVLFQPLRLAVDCVVDAIVRSLMAFLDLCRPSLQRPDASIRVPYHLVQKCFGPRSMMFSLALVRILPECFEAGLAFASGLDQCHWSTTVVWRSCQYLLHMFGQISSYGRAVMRNTNYICGGRRLVIASSSGRNGAAQILVYSTGR